MMENSWIVNLKHKDYSEADLSAIRGRIAFLEERRKIPNEYETTW